MRLSNQSKFPLQTHVEPGRFWHLASIEDFIRVFLVILDRKTDKVYVIRPDGSEPEPEEYDQVEVFLQTTTILHEPLITPEVLYAHR
jgi:hypothetical protein